MAVADLRLCQSLASCRINVLIEIPQRACEIHSAVPRCLIELNGRSVMRVSKRRSEGSPGDIGLVRTIREAISGGIGQ